MINKATHIWSVWWFGGTEIFQTFRLKLIIKHSPIKYAHAVSAIITASIKRYYFLLFAICFTTPQLHIYLDKCCFFL